jgi:transcription initiation factor TFIIB
MDIEELFSNFKNLNIEQSVALEKSIKPVKLDQCRQCNSGNLITNKGKVICKECGNINYDMIDTNPEWRYYGCDDSKYSDPTRVGLPTNNLLPQSSLGSTIGFRYGESYEMKKIRNYHLWNAMPYKERSLYNVFDSIQVRATNNGIPLCIIEEAKNLYKQISDVRIHRGSNRNGIIASCIYKACRLQGCPRSAKEIADIFKLNISHMTKGCKKFDEIINMNVCNNSTMKNNATKSSDFVQRFCSKLNIGNNICQLCIQVCEKAEEYNLVSKCIPPSIASGSIFLVCSLLKINITKKEISLTCQISEVTISKCYKNLYTYHQHILPNNILNKLYPNLNK